MSTLNPDIEHNHETVEHATATHAVKEDQAFDTLDEALAALEDDDTLTDEHSERDHKGSDAEKDGEALAGEALGGEDFDDHDEVLVTLSDGEQLSLGELKKGYFRHQDYTRQTDTLAQERKAVDALREDYGQHAQTLQQAYHHLTQLVEGLVPAEPDLALAQSDPAAYQYQTALRTNALAELQTIYTQREQANAHIQHANETDLARVRATETEKLLNAMPTLKEPSRKAAFDAHNKKTALAFGFSEHDIDLTTDHRILQLVHYARLGKLAEQNRQNAQRRLAEKPRKGQRATTATNPPSQRREAMKRLAQSGAFEDALAIDFD